MELAEADDWLNTEIIRQVSAHRRGDEGRPVEAALEAAYEGKAGEMLNFARARIAFVKCELERAGNASCRPV